ARRAHARPRPAALAEDAHLLRAGTPLLPLGGGPAQPTAAPRAAGPPADPERRLRVLFDLSRIIGADIDSEELVGRMIETALAVLGCGRGVAGLSDGASVGGRRIVRPRGDDVVVSRALIDAMLTRRQAVRV